MDGVRVIRVWSFLSPNRGKIRRTFSYLSFMVSAIFFCFRYPRFDVLMATSPHFFTAIAGWVVSILRRRRWVFEVRDLWPASMGAVGVANSWTLWTVEKMELFLYRQAARVLVVTEGFKDDLVHRKIDPEKIDIVTNGVDSEMFNRQKILFDARERLGIPPDAFLAGYIGTTGMSQGLEAVVDAAAICRHHENIQFLILGDGAQRMMLEERVQQLGLDNVQFADLVPQRDLPSYLAALDLSIIHLRPDPVFRSVIPSKLFEAMAMEVPILMGVEGEASRIVERSNCGICVPSGNSRAIADVILKIADNRESLEQMGMAGLTAAQDHYNRRVKALAVLKTLAAAGNLVLPQNRTSPQPHKGIDGERKFAA